MNRPLLSMLLIYIFCGLSQGANALGEIRTCNFGSAKPSSWVRVYYGSGIRMESVISSLTVLEKKPASDICGGAFGLKLLPKLELDGWWYAHSRANAYELQAKVLLAQYGSTYISAAPGLLYSDGDQDYQHYENYYDYGTAHNNCRIKGLGVPVTYTFDTQRNLLVNFMAGVNLIWVENAGHTTTYNYDTHQYDIRDFQYAEGPLPSGRLGISIEANSEAFSLIPELGVSFLNVRDEGFRPYPNLGLSLGFRW